MNNILWLSHFIPHPPKGGMLQRSYNLLREAARQNRVHLLALRQKSIHPTDDSVQESIDHLSTLCASVTVVDNPWERHPFYWYILVLSSVFTRNPYTVNWTTSGEMARKCREIVDREHVDLVHFDTIGLAECLEEIGAKKCVLNHHNIESDLMLKRGAKEPNPLKRLYYHSEGRKLARYEHNQCPRFHKNITVSEVDSEVLSGMLSGVDITDIPNGVDIDYFKPLESPIKKHSLIFAGSLDWYPNIKAVEWFCEEIWPELKAKVPDASLVIAGRKPSSDFVRQFRSLPDVSVLPDVPDIRPIIAAAEVYVCPIRHSGGTKLKVLDALAMGKAMVAHPVACEGIDVSHNHNVLLASTPEEYVEAILRLFADDGLKKTLGENGRQLAEEVYSFRKIGAKLCTIYDELVHGRPY